MKKPIQIKILQICALVILGAFTKDIVPVQLIQDEVEKSTPSTPSWRPAGARSQYLVDSIAPKFRYRISPKPMEMTFNRTPLPKATWKHLFLPPVIPSHSTVANSQWPQFSNFPPTPCSIWKIAPHKREIVCPGLSEIEN